MEDIRTVDMENNQDLRLVIAQEDRKNMVWYKNPLK